MGADEILDAGIALHPMSEIIESLAETMQHVDDDNGDGGSTNYYRSLAYATVDASPELFRSAVDGGQPAVVSATAVVSAPGAPNPQADSVMPDTLAPGRKATCPQCGLEPIADGYSVCEVCAFAPGRILAAQPITENGAGA